MRDILIVNTTIAEWDLIIGLFEKVMRLQGEKGYKVWTEIDQTALRRDIETGLQYKITSGDAVLCLFSIQLRDPFIWRERDRADAIYLHRIVTNPDYKGQGLFKKVLDWATGFAREHNLSYVRMDTWADNQQLIDYYRTFGFTFVENYKTTDVPELPQQNRNLDVALLEVQI